MITMQKQVDHLHTADDVRRLATVLQDPNRDLPVVVVSTPTGSTEPRFLMEQVAREVGDTALINVIPTGPLTYHLSDTLGDDFGVYAGAGRIYPAGTDWLDDRSLAPLVFAYPGSDNREVTNKLTRRVQEVAGKAEAFNVTVTSGGRTTQHTLIADGPDWATVMAAVQADHEARQQTAVTAPAATVVPAPMQTVTAVPATRKKMAAEIEALTAEIGRQQQEINRLTAMQPGNTNRALREQVTNLEDLIEEARNDARAARVETARAEAKLAAALAAAKENGRRIARSAKKGGNAVSTAERPIPIDMFPTADAAARHAILLAWVDRIPAAEKTERPLPDYRLSDGFTDSFEPLTDTQTTKALRCVVDILTGRDDLAARRVHPLRTSEAGNAPAWVRDDGAVCFRANIESNTASARRLHYWKLPDGTLELIRIVVHDTFEP
ncbi:hypothetical protein [Curtobacterium sp. MCSS17_016]|uniref:hypothetical protein n=1 Tax=Curtobacterium sp. MCSS17_016 TaxID=2175644 RepID=UPI000DA76628|nr:hypothetical protein [Curtobacterium sp. MCSS17_016]WIE81001.1 hypothetical protein DEJ19_021025 [Curtobacterium sp. MCSS17_016]